MRYISLFSGIGGLEATNESPTLICEIDTDCQSYLAHKYPEARIETDVRSLTAPPAELVAGGWPCQDISAAGLRRGLQGERSGLFFRMLEVAAEAGAHTIVAENVPNLLRMENGSAFRLAVAALRQGGFNFVAWRTLNAREFALPQSRKRVFIVASKHRELAESLHRPVGHGAVISLTPAAGFYWTAGLQGICYSQGYVPALKIGSSIGIASPPALHFEDVVRKASADECLRFQGFNPADFVGIPTAAKYSMAGNAVALPAGRFVMDGVMTSATPNYMKSSFFDLGTIPESGIDFGDGLMGVSNVPTELSANLAEYIDREDKDCLSQRAARGLLLRLSKSGKPCPDSLRARLEAISGNLGWSHIPQEPAASCKSSTV